MKLISAFFVYKCTACYTEISSVLRPQRRAFAESGAANAVFLYDPTCGNGVLKSPQAFQNPKIINNLSAEYAQSNAEGIPNRLVLQQ